MSAMPPPLVLQGLAAACLLTSVSGFLAWKHGSAGRLTDLAGGLSLLLALGATTLRAFAAGRLPTFGTYESSLSLATCVLAAALITRLLRRRLEATWPVAGLVAGVVLLHGLGFKPEIEALTISERSWVVDLHALIAWAACAMLAVNAGLGLRLSFGPPPRVALDEALSWTLRAGFLLHAAMLVSGSLYEFLLFGRAWSFDPIETMGLSCWLAYGALLHCHLLAGWRGRRLGRWCLGLFLLLVVSYRAALYFPPGSSYHVFDIELRMHVVGSEAAPQSGEP